MQYLFFVPLCLLLAAVFIYFEHGGKYVPAVLFKGLASVCFVLFGLLGSRLCGDLRFARLVLIGLILGAAADVLLNLRFVFEKAGQKIFLFGILVFLSGHILYLAALIPLCEPLWLCLAAGVAATALLMVWIFSQITAKKAFKIFGVFYIGAITLMTSAALGRLISAPSVSAAVFFAGAVCFLISDIVLILNTFGQSSRFSLRITNLGLYYIGQLLIAASLQLM